MILPVGWSSTTAAEACDLVQSGGTPRSGFIDHPGIPFLKVYNIVGQKVSFHYRSQFITESVHRADLRKSIAVPGDVLMNIVGPPLGKVAIVPDEFSEWNVNQALTIFRPSGAVLSRWLYYFLRGGSSVQSIINQTRGSAGQVNISLSQCRQFSIQLPPVAEQRRIVTRLDSLTARLLRARTEIDQARTLATKIRLSALRSVFHFDTLDMPIGWSRKRIDEIADVQLGRQRSPKDHTGPNMRPYLRAANITWSGWDLSDVKEMNFSPAEFQAFHLKSGDILLNEGSGSAKEVGKPAVWRGEIADVCFQNTLLRVRPRNYDPNLLRYCLLYLALSGQFIANTKGVNIIHIGKAGLARILIPEPPESEQGELLKRLNRAFARADCLEAETARARALIDRLEAAILSKAFRGDLLPQDPNEEPASVALERVSHERISFPKAKRDRAVT